MRTLRCCAAGSAASSLAPPLSTTPTPCLAAHRTALPRTPPVNRLHRHPFTASTRSLTPAHTGSFVSGSRALAGAHEAVPNAAMRLYGGAQFHRAMSEFRLVVGGLACPELSHEEIVNACGLDYEGGHDGVRAAAPGRAGGVRCVGRRRLRCVMIMGRG